MKALSASPDSIGRLPKDTTAQVLPLPKDTLPFANADTVDLVFSDDALDEAIKYNAEDSIIYDVTNSKIYLYGLAEISQGEITLKADRVVMDQASKTVMAYPTSDSLGNVVGKPVFSEKDNQFEADTIAYNFDTKKGKISQFVTRQGEGLLRGGKVKKNEFDELFAKDAFYTTCNRDHPHFRIEVNKLKVIPKKVIVSGPAQLYIAEIPTPIILPFAIFPMFESRTSGIIFPEYGYSDAQGYYLQNGGYYFGLNDNFDLALTGDIYTNGSWRTVATTRYKKRYKYGGRISLDYGKTRTGDPITPDFSIRRNFWMRWNHNQDAKARPNTTFTANVNFGTSSFNREYAATNTEAVLNNTFTSGINYRMDLPNSPFSLSLNASHSQNTNTNIVNLTLPEVTVNMTRQFPFKRKVQVGEQRWYEKIGIPYSMNAKASVSAPDSVLFTSKVWDEVRTGMEHRTSLGTNFRLFKYINVNPSVRYEGTWYLQSIEKTWTPDTTINELTGEVTIANNTVVDTLGGFKALSDFSGSIGMTTKLFGLLQFKKGKVKAIRHEVTPSITANFKPDFGKEFWGYYDYVNFRNSDGELDSTRYSRFENGIYGTPSAGKQAALAFSISNNLQMKVRSKKDTVSGERKVSILDRLTMTTNYNFAADSLKLSKFNFTGGTNILKKINLNFSGRFDPYVLNPETGRNENKFEWGENKRLLRFERFQTTIGTSISSNELSKPKSDKGSLAEREDIENRPEAYINFNIPWRFNIDYTLLYTTTMRNNLKVKTVTQTLNFSGDVNLTPNWKLAFRSGYDFTNKAIANTRLNVSRDLHCWQMDFTIVPFGVYRSYDFTIRVKSSLLQDLKYNRNRNWRDF